MSWLLRDGDVLATLEEPRRGWASSLRGAVVLRGPGVVHTLLAPVALDLAWCTTVFEGDKEELEVLRVSNIGPGRVARPRLYRNLLVVANEGSFERWRLKVGDRLEVRRV